MEDLQLLPEIGVRDIRVGFRVGDRTVATHAESRRKAPVVLSLEALLRSLRGDGAAELFHCRCGNPDCDEAPAVRTELAGDAYTWKVQVGENELRYQFSLAQASAETKRVIGLVNSKTERSHPGRYRFHPPEDAELFAFQSANTGRGRTAFANLAYFSVVVTVVALALGLFSAF